MLSIKFRDRKRVTVKEKIGVINAIFDIIDVEKRNKIFYSDYTFSEVEESHYINWLDDLLENNTLDKLDNDFFITVTAETPYGPIRVEINPSIARKNVFNCSHIDISLENDFLLYDVLKEGKKIESLRNYFDREKREIVSEFYFFDLSRSPNCYSDIRNRLFSKVYDEFEFSNLLLKDYERLDDKLKEKTVKAIGFNFTSRIFQEEHQPFIQGLIYENNLNVTCAAGSLTFNGSDVSKFIDLLTAKLNEYIDRIMEKNIYKTEFNNVFKSKNRR